MPQLELSMSEDARRYGQMINVDGGQDFSGLIHIGTKTRLPANHGLILRLRGCDEVIYFLRFHSLFARTVPGRAGACFASAK